MTGYARLAAHLRVRAEPRATLTFDADRGDPRRAAALAARVQRWRQRPAPGSRTPQARAWLDTGWQVEHADLYAATVTFVNEAGD